MCHCDALQVGYLTFPSCSKSEIRLRYASLPALHFFLLVRLALFLLAVLTIVPQVLFQDI